LMNKIKSYNIRTLTIGLGNSNKGGNNDKAFDEDKLISLASPRGNYFKAENVAQLRITGNTVRKSVSQIVTITFCTGDNDLNDLRSMRFDITYSPPDGKIFKGQITWICRNSITGCVPDRSGALRQEEETAMGKSNCDKNPIGAWKQILLLFGQMALFSGGV